MSDNSFGARASLAVGDRSYTIYRLDAMTGGDVASLPYSLKILLENLLRHEDGVSVRSEDVDGLARWIPGSASESEIAFVPARVLMQDFTGVPAPVDLAAMRSPLAGVG